jgi:hypothetical protein
MEASLFGVLDVEGLQIQATPSGEPECELGAYELVSLTADPLRLRVRGITGSSLEPAQDRVAARRCARYEARAPGSEGACVHGG